VNRQAYINRDKDLVKGRRRRTRNPGRPDVRKPRGMKTRDRQDPDTQEVAHDVDTASVGGGTGSIGSVQENGMERARSASLTGKVEEFSVGQQVFPVYPVARPIIGVVVGANKVEGKVYVSYNGRVVQHDPEEIQLAAGSPFFMVAGGRTASTEGDKLVRCFLAAVEKTSLSGSAETDAGRLAVALQDQGLTANEALELAEARVAGMNQARQAATTPLTPGEPVVLMRDGGRMPGYVGVFVGTRGDEALVDVHTDWTSRRDGSRVVRVPADAVVPIDTPLRRRLASQDKPQVSERAKRIAAQVIGSGHNERRWQFKNPNGEAWVETTVTHGDGRTAYDIVAYGRQRGVAQTLYHDGGQAETPVADDRRSAENVVEKLVDNATNAAQKFVRERLLQDCADGAQRKFMKERANAPEVAVRKEK